MRYPEVVAKLIFEKYTPRLPGKDGAPGKPDPAVLYVGPFLDGVGTYLPEIFTLPFPKSYGQGNARRHLKSLLAAASPSAPAGLSNARDIRFSMRRSTWPHKTKEPLTIVLGERVKEGEPGELLNSYEMRLDEETGQAAPMERVKKTVDQYKPFDPLIREDKRYGLHYLLRNDYFEFQFKTRKGANVLMRFELRSLAEGSSLLTPERTVDVVEW